MKGERMKINAKRKHSIVMIQVNYQYGSNIFVPYSVGSIQAYAETIPEIKESFQFQRPLFLRKDPVEVVKAMEEPAVVGFSCYLWNWEYNKEFAKAVRAAFPHCLIVFGGTQVPNASENFFVEHPYIDILVHHEGEFSFAAILLEFLSAQPDYSKISGLSIRVEGNRTLKTAPAVRIKDLSKLPSPYLSGVFDFLLDNGFLLNVSQETIRGCPYSCTFCDWGEDTYAKLFKFDKERILGEFEWFGRNKAEYLFSCDSNWGILKERDLAFTECMIATRAKYGGFPRKFRMCTAKNSNDTIFTIAKILNDVGMSKGATLSFQSMNEKTLNIVKRRNIKPEVFFCLMDRYRANNITTYTELIMGMPGETYESSKKGIDMLFEGHADSINLNVYVCTMLLNSEMSEPNSVRLNKIKSVRMPILLGHSTPEYGLESIGEYEDVVVETASMSNVDWQRVYLFYWAVQALHCLGLTRYIAILFRKHFEVRYSDFYEKLIEYFGSREETLAGKEIVFVRNIVAHSVSVNGGRLDIVLPQFGNIYWPLEEASFLTLVTNKDEFYRELRSFVGYLARSLGQPVDEVLLDDVVRYQSAVVKDPYIAESTIELAYDFLEYFSNFKGEAAPLRIQSKILIKAKRDFDGDIESFAREVVWYGRKGGSFCHTDIKGKCS